MSKFEKISFDEFSKVFAKKFKSEAKMKEAYDSFNLPFRMTKESAGHDFETIVPFSIAPGEMKLIPTGIKCEIKLGQVLLLYPRSSTGIKKHLMLANTVGVIDSDYYNNSDNEGHIFLPLYNYGSKIVKGEVGDRFVQGIITYFDAAYNSGIVMTREGGMGSTN